VAAVLTHGRHWRVPDRYNPWAPLRIDEVRGLLTRDKLARLDGAPASCLAALQQATIRFTPVADRTVEPGCGFDNAVRIERTSVQVVEPFTLSCRAAVSLALWERHALQPAAKSMLGSRVRRIEHYGSFACRNVNGREGGRPASTPRPTRWIWLDSCSKTAGEPWSLRIGAATMNGRPSCGASTTELAVSSTASSGPSTTPHTPTTCTWTAGRTAGVVERMPQRNDAS